jgi:hypothetical protein
VKLEAPWEWHEPELPGYQGFYYLNLPEDTDPHTIARVLLSLPADAKLNFLGEGNFLGGIWYFPGSNRITL